MCIRFAFANFVVVEKRFQIVWFIDQHSCIVSSDRIIMSQRDASSIILCFPHPSWTYHCDIQKSNFCTALHHNIRFNIFLHCLFYFIHDLCNSFFKSVPCARLQFHTGSPLIPIRCGCYSGSEACRTRRRRAYSSSFIGYPLGFTEESSV